MKIIVYHTTDGSETGCCGHRIKVDDLETQHFEYGHPWREEREEAIEYAKELVLLTLGKEHVQDLDWDNCHIVYGEDCDW